MRALASASVGSRASSRTLAWLGIVVSLCTTGCGLLLDTAPPDPVPDASADASRGDAAADRDGNVPRDAGEADGSNTDIDAAADLDASVLDATVLDASDADAGDLDAGTLDLGIDATICHDLDGDGTTTCAGDCDDGDALSAPGAPEICGDGADNDCDVLVDESCMGGRGTFVSALTGDDLNPGTRALPVRTIGQGTRNAQMLGLPQTVVVAEGSYGEKVIMVGGVTLLGGYQCSASPCSWLRSPPAFIATIVNTDFEGVFAGAGVTAATVIDGFHIDGRSGTATTPGSAGITVRGGSPTISGNKIVGGNLSGGPFGADRSIGVHLRASPDGAATTIIGNDIRGGMSSGTSTALMFDAFPLTTGAVATVTGNVLRGGTALRSTGITAWNAMAGTLFADNDIYAGDSLRGVSIGIEVGANVTIDGNRINADASATGTCTNPTSWCAGIASQSATSVITNNVVFGPRGPKSAGVHLGESETAAGIVVLNGNFIDGGGGASPGGATMARSAALVVTIGSCVSCGLRGVVGRVRNNILMGGSGVLRFGVIEEPATGRVVRPEALENNLFHFAPSSATMDVLYRQIGLLGGVTDHTDIATVNAIIAPPADANLSADPRVDASWHLLPGSPCIEQGTTTDAPPVDFDGELRPRGDDIDIGADEF